MTHQEHLDRLPPRLLPVLYFGSAHLFLILGLGFAAKDPAPLLQFYYQPRTLGLVHFITLGWITLSILGAIYIVGPLALKMRMPARRLDYVAFGASAIGIAGLVGHFLVDEYGGLAWSAGLLMLGLIQVADRTLRSLGRSPIERPVKVHIALAFFNVLVIAAAGLLLGLNKVRPILPVDQLELVHAHAHLAALGWAAMMVFGVGYRLLPMVLPSPLPRGPSLYLCAGFLQAGSLGLFAGFIAGGRWLPFFALISIAGFGVFYWHLWWMLMNPRRPPAGSPRPDYGKLHALQAMIYLPLAAAAGLALLFLPDRTGSVPLAAAYGVLGLIGFLSQIVLGVGSRILPMFTAYHAKLDTPEGRSPTLPHQMPHRGLQAATFYLWSAGVPALTAGLLVESILWVEVGTLLLLGASVLAAINTGIVFRFAFAGGTGNTHG